MKRTIFKYPIEITDMQCVLMPYGAKILTAQMQRGKLCLWAEVDPDQPHVQGKIIRIYGTGRELPENPGRHIGTVQESIFVWHVYEAER